MNFADIFKRSFLEGFAGGEITLPVILSSLGMASALAFYMFLVYRVTTRRAFYSKGFNISLAGTTVISAALILTMQSSVVLSLGMVGALSIVRFRTAIKDPLDLMFLFWAIAVGIICGAGLAQVALVLCIIITLGILALSRFPEARAPMILVVNASCADAEKAVCTVTEKYARHVEIKSRNMTEQTVDLVIELRTSQGGEMLQEIAALSCVTSASLLSHDGETVY